jgi:hypothetical protein
MALFTLRKMAAGGMYDHVGRPLKSLHEVAGDVIVYE